MKAMNSYLLDYLNVQAYDYFFCKLRVAVSTTAMLMELTPFQCEYNHEHDKLSTTNLRGNEKDYKNSRFWNCYIGHPPLLEAQLSLFYCLSIEQCNEEIREM